ncbi:formylglycine-generating enzyme family protein [Aquimarina sp. ERC-38]|uniref:formylglycine-generating enzyme family protein n=1 Tax=Aquimarina sp. ERC-38 TaxID=2949996 RepID=UPI0022459270|nr:formylglycine-generating enzyme family protein [Aquimarina sp. ERC-38]UZO82242.1 formylglycine-generating enzyme family protein [Aquimarina sp. ERC-38]
MKSKSNTPLFTIGLLILLMVYSCKNEVQNEKKNEDKEEKKEETIAVKTPEGMVWVAPKKFLQGGKANDPYAMMREKPAHYVSVDGFFIDITEVTNKQYKDFVDATGYITVAEREIDWELLKKDLPPGTPKPHDSILQPGSLTFNKNVEAVANMENYTQWWTWKIGANWKQPQGPGSSIEGQDYYPVVHIAYEDAVAYCKWANRRLPTEAEWEAAAQGEHTNAIFTWGNNPELLDQKANTWQGTFPTLNDPVDGFKYISPVKSYEPNSIGIYDMSGNVWEITSDYFNVSYYANRTDEDSTNPKGADKSYNPNNPYAVEHVIKGGSFLCHASYCASYRISARMGTTADSGSDHVGFRTVATKEMLLNGDG